MSDIEQLIERVIGCAFEEGENDRDYIGGHTSELKIAKSNLLSSIAKHETQLAEYRAVIVALWPVFSSALGYAEHGSSKELNAMRANAEAVQHNPNYKIEALLRAIKEE